MFGQGLRDLGHYAAARTYQRYLTASEVGEESTLAGSGAVFGDMMSYDGLSIPSGYVVEIDDSGVASIATGGAESQQSFREDLYSILARTWTGSVTNYVNPHAPSLFNPDIESIEVNAGLLENLFVDLNPQFSDEDNDSLTITLAPGSTDPIPTPLTLAAGVLGGITPAAEGTFLLLIRATDGSGLYEELLVILTLTAGPGEAVELTSRPPLTLREFLLNGDV